MGLFDKKEKTEEDIREDEIDSILDYMCGKRINPSPVFCYIVFDYVDISLNGLCNVFFSPIKSILKNEMLNQNLSEEDIEQRIIELIQLDYEKIKKENLNLYSSTLHTQEDLINAFDDYNPEKFYKKQEKIKKAQLKYKEYQNENRNKNISKNDFQSEIKRVVDGYYFKYKLAYFNLDDITKNNIKTILELEYQNNQLAIEDIEERANDLMLGDDDLDEMKNNLVQQNAESSNSNESEVYDFSCSIDEIRTNWAGERRRERRNCYVKVLEDRLIIQKTGVFIKSDLGNRTIYFSDIGSIDFDKAGLMHVTNSINIVMKGGEQLTLIYTDESNFILINEKWGSYKEKLHMSQTVVSPQQIPQNTEKTTNNADELLKYADLYERGLLTKEEFDMKKEELLFNKAEDDTPINPQPLYCTKCGKMLDEDSKFCMYCGNKII